MRTSNGPSLSKRSSMIRLIGDVTAMLCGLAGLLSVRRSQPVRGQDGRPPRVLAVIPNGPSRALLQAVSEETGLVLSLTDNPSLYLNNAGGPVPAIVIYDREIASPEWRQGIRCFANLSPRPYVMLLSSNADTNLWEEVQRVGGSDIVRSPLDRDCLLEALRTAWRLWRTQQRVKPGSRFTK